MWKDGYAVTPQSIWAKAQTIQSITRHRGLMVAFKMIFNNPVRDEIFNAMWIIHLYFVTIIKECGDTFRQLFHESTFRWKGCNVSPSDIDDLNVFDIEEQRIKQVDCRAVNMTKWSCRHIPEDKTYPEMCKTIKVTKRRPRKV
jgi:hypothetical protein